MNSSVARQISRLVDSIGTVIVGKRTQVEDCVACLLAGGHLLIEDVPGVGKTTLAHALAVCLGLKFSRVQFTADLMPSDLVGVSVFERSKENFVLLCVFNTDYEVTTIGVTACDKAGLPVLATSIKAFADAEFILSAFEILTGNDVYHAGYGISTVNGRSTIFQNFNTLNHSDRNG